jgi:hypothetical protein
MLENQFPMYFSAIAAAEFSIKQPVIELPLKNFRELHFNTVHSITTAAFWNALGGHDGGDARVSVRDDLKLIAQADRESIPFILTEDASSLYKYCERLRVAKVSNVKAIKLIDGFDPDSLQKNVQRGLKLDLTDDLWGTR